MVSFFIVPVLLVLGVFFAAIIVLINFGEDEDE